MADEFEQSLERVFSRFDFFPEEQPRNPGFLTPQQISQLPLCAGLGGDDVYAPSSCVPPGEDGRVWCYREHLGQHRNNQDWIQANNNNLAAQGQGGMGIRAACSAAVTCWLAPTKAAAALAGITDGPSLEAALSEEGSPLRLAGATPEQIAEAVRGGVEGVGALLEKLNLPAAPQAPAGASSQGAAYQGAYANAAAAVAAFATAQWQYRAFGNAAGVGQQRDVLDKHSKMKQRARHTPTAAVLSSSSSRPRHHQRHQHHQQQQARHNNSSSSSTTRTHAAAIELLALQDDAQQPPTPAARIERFGFRAGFLYEFDRGQMIGSGSFGVVHVARHIKTGHTYAVKSIPKVYGDDYALEPAFAQRIFHEVDVCRHMGQSLNVVHLVEAFEDDVSVDLVLELASGGSLWSRIQRGGTSEQQAARIITDVLRAVAQCHAKGVLLRDVKPENFLFVSRRESSPLKMVDFGLAQFCRPGHTFTERAGTPYYVAPEVLKQQYSYPADVWSAGVTAYQLLTGRLPWANDAEWLSEVASVSSAALLSGFGSSAAAHGGLPGHGPGGPNLPSGVLWRAILYAELDFTWPPWDTIPGGARDLVASMLQRDPSLRPTAAELLQHPWLVEAGRCRACWSPNEAAACSNIVAAASTPSSSSSNGSSSNGSSGGQQQQQQPVPLWMQPLEDTLVQRLQRYGTFSRLKQVALRAVVEVIPLSQQPPCLAVYAAEFAALDVGGTGRLPAESLVTLLSSDKWDLTDVEVRMLVSQFDCDHDGCVEIEEWLSALIDWPIAQQHPQWMTWLAQVYASFDQDGDGVLSGPELLALLQGPGHKGWSELDGPVKPNSKNNNNSHSYSSYSTYSSYSGAGGGDGGEGDAGLMCDALQSALRHADLNGDGQLSFEEFVALLQTADMDQLDLFPSRRCNDGSSTPLLATAAADGSS